MLKCIPSFQGGAKIEPDSLASLIGDMFADLAAEAQQEGWKITDASRADWALQKLGHLRLQEQQDIVVAKDMIHRAESWLKKRGDARQPDLDFFAGVLREWHEARLAEDPDLKTISLPSGELKMRQNQPDYQRDEKLLLEWAQEGHPEFVKKTPKLDWMEIKRVAKTIDNRLVLPETGEYVPGVQLVDQPPTHTVSTRL